MAICLLGRCAASSERQSVTGTTIQTTCLTTSMIDLPSLVRPMTVVFLLLLYTRPTPTNPWSASHVVVSPRKIHMHALDRSLAWAYRLAGDIPSWQHNTQIRREYSL
jgi:hypothetical protein